MIKAAIFDMDGLLINSEPFWRRSQKKILPPLGIELREEMFTQFMGKRVDEVVSLIYRQFPWSGPSCDEVVSSVVESVIEMVKEEGESMDGVMQILNLFRKLNIRIALASSSNLKIIDTVVKKLNIEEYFEVIHSAELEQYGKPHPQIFITTAQKLGVLPEECIVFEDSFNGVIAALASNMKCVAVPDPDYCNMEKFVVAHITLKSLAHFSPEHIQILEADSTKKSSATIN